MSSLKFLIERIWTDSMENEVNSAVGYSSYGYVNTKSEAELFCSKGKNYTEKDCWAIMGTYPEFRFKELQLINL